MISLWVYFDNYLTLQLNNREGILHFNVNICTKYYFCDIYENIKYMIMSLTDVSKTI